MRFGHTSKMYGGNRIDDKAQLVTNSQEDDQEELSGARGSPDPVLVDLSDSSNARFVLGQ